MHAPRPPSGSTPRCSSGAVGGGAGKCGAGCCERQQSRCFNAVGGGAGKAAVRTEAAAKWPGPGAPRQWARAAVWTATAAARGPGPGAPRQWAKAVVWTEPAAARGPGPGAPRQRAKAVVWTEPAASGPNPDPRRASGRSSVCAAPCGGARAAWQLFVSMGGYDTCRGFSP